jgi:ABC-type lipoprotein export system ATPase subunit
MFVQVNNLAKTYQTPNEPLSVFHDVNLTLQRGDFAALIGASGSGKTTFLNMLTAIDSPTHGEVIIDGKNVTTASQRELTKWRIKNLGIVFQFFQLFPTLSVVQNVVAPMDFAKMYDRSERKDRAMELLDMFGIADQADKKPSMLSGGQQQRVAIARALATKPPFIIGDELTANLDRMSAENVYQILSDLTEQGTTVLVVSYDRELMYSVPRLFELENNTITETSHERVAVPEPA